MEYVKGIFVILLAIVFYIIIPIVIVMIIRRRLRLEIKKIKKPIDDEKNQTDPSA